MIPDKILLLHTKLKKYLSKLISLGFIGLGVKGIYEEVYKILIIYPRLAHHLAKVNVTTDIYDAFIRNSVYIVVAHLMLATLGVALLASSHRQAQKLKFFFGTVILIIAYAATHNFQIPSEAKNYMHFIIEGLVFSRH